jgi:hypothetical protein
MRDIVVTRNLGEHPEQRQIAVVGVVASVLADAFPCRLGATFC